MILDSSEHLLDLVNSILDLAKIESGKMGTVMRPEPLRTLIDKIVRTYQPPAHKEGSETGRDAFADDLPADFVCDATRVVQVLNNLLSNAIKFTDHGRVSPRLTGGRRAGFVVADSGCGIAPDMLSHVFERFSQTDNFLTRRRRAPGWPGAGEGLVDLMGGSVNVRSETERAASSSSACRWATERQQRRGSPSPFSLRFFGRPA